MAITNKNYSPNWLIDLTNLIAWPPLKIVDSNYNGTTYSIASNYGEIGYNENAYPIVYAYPFNPEFPQPPALPKYYVYGNGGSSSINPGLQMLFNNNDPTIYMASGVPISVDIPNAFAEAKLNTPAWQQAVINFNTGKPNTPLMTALIKNISQVVGGIAPGTLSQAHVQGYITQMSRGGSGGWWGKASDVVIPLVVLAITGAAVAQAATAASAASTTTATVPASTTTSTFTAAGSSGTLTPAQLLSTGGGLTAAPVATVAPSASSAFLTAGTTTTSFTAAAAPALTTTVGTMTTTALTGSDLVGAALVNAGVSASSLAIVAPTVSASMATVGFSAANSPTVSLATDITISPQATQPTSVTQPQSLTQQAESLYSQAKQAYSTIQAVQGAAAAKAAQAAAAKKAADAQTAAQAAQAAQPAAPLTTLSPGVILAALAAGAALLM